jgi:hypothetical protein
LVVWVAAPVGTWLRLVLVSSEDLGSPDVAEIDLGSSRRTRPEADWVGVEEDEWLMAQKGERNLSPPLGLWTPTLAVAQRSMAGGRRQHATERAARRGTWSHAR